MNSAHRINDTAGAPSTGAPIITGRLPTRNATACAEVLSRVLSGEVLTGMDAVSGASTTRLAAHVGYLESQWGWWFERGSKVVGCSDGRVVTITTYAMSDATIARVMASGGKEWCAEVRCARTALRAKAEQAKKVAEKANADAIKRRRAAHSLDQFDLFGEVMQ
jgi:hypothetical protein